MICIERKNGPWKTNGIVLWFIDLTSVQLYILLGNYFFPAQPRIVKKTPWWQIQIHLNMCNRCVCFMACLTILVVMDTERVARFLSLTTNILHVLSCTCIFLGHRLRRELLEHRVIPLLILKDMFKLITLTWWHRLPLLPYDRFFKKSFSLYLGLCGFSNSIFLIGPPVQLLPVLTSVVIALKLHVGLLSKHR